MSQSKIKNKYEIEEKKLHLFVDTFGATRVNDPLKFELNYI